MKIYNILFNLSMKIDKFTCDDVKQHGTYGPENDLCDSLIFIPIKKLENDQEELKMFSVDGETKKMLDGKELFKYWSMLGKIVSESDSLTEKDKQIAKWAFDSFIEKVNGIVIN